MSDIRELIERLEAATEGSRELDALVCEAIYQVTVDRTSPNSPVVWTPQHVTQGGEIMEIDAADRVAAYTTSLDAALTLVPEGWRWLVSNRAPAPHRARAYLHNNELRFVGVGAMRANPNYRGAEVTAAMPALALCIASLRARFPEAQS